MKKPDTETEKKLDDNSRENFFKLSVYLSWSLS